MARIWFARPKQPERAATRAGGPDSREPRVGDVAPDFELAGTEGPFRLAEHRGSRVVLLFYPGDETPVCTKQFCSYRDRADDFAALDATVVGISAQDVDSHERFTAHHGLTVPLLADVDKAVARRYGVTRPIVGTQRATFVIDEQGLIAWCKVHTIGLDFVGVDELRDVLASLPAPSESAGASPGVA